MTTSFPISVSAVYSIIAAKKDTSANSVPDVQNYSSTGFAYYGPSPYAWFAVCKAQQWGITPELTFNSTTTITYSLPLATTLYINAFMYGGGLNKCVQLPQILSQTSTSAQIYITWATDSAGYHGSVTWLAIGKQQWGVADNGVAAQNWSKTITLPIAFSNPNYIVAGSATIIDGIYVLFTHSNKTTSSVLIFVSGCWDGNTSRYANWFALGYQQWGVVTDDRSTLTFLLPFSNSDYFYAVFPTNKVNAGGINLHGVRHPTYLELYSSISNNSDTVNNWQFSGRSMSPCWLAVGIQQWGTNQPSPITFPVSFASKCLTVVPQLQASGDSGNMSKNRVCVTNLTARGFALELPQSTYNYIAIGI